MRVSTAVALAVVTTSGAWRPAHTQGSPRDRVREAQIEQQLRALAPAAVPAFAAATAAMDQRDCGRAAALYEQVIGHAPGFSPAVRRLGLCLIELGQRDAGLNTLDRALQMERSAENLFSLASALGSPAPGRTLSHQDDLRCPAGHQRRYRRGALPSRYRGRHPPRPDRAFPAGRRHHWRGTVHPRGTGVGPVREPRGTQRGDDGGPG